MKIKITKQEYEEIFDSIVFRGIIQFSDKENNVFVYDLITKIHNHIKKYNIDVYRLYINLLMINFKDKVIEFEVTHPK